MQIDTKRASLPQPAPNSNKDITLFDDRISVNISDNIMPAKIMGVFDAIKNRYPTSSFIKRLQESAYFQGVVKNGILKQSSGIVVLKYSFDTLDNLNKYRKVIENDSFTFGSFQCVPDTDLALLVRTQPTPDNDVYMEKYKAISEHYNIPFLNTANAGNIEPIPYDRDEDLYCNPGAKVFEAKEESIVINNVPTHIKPVNTVKPTQTQFWEISPKGKVIFLSEEFIKWLESYGYRTVKIGSNIELVQIVGNIVKKIDTSDIKLFTINYLKEEPKIQRYVMDRVTLFSINYLNALQCVEITMNRDTAKSSFLYYKNGVVEITKDEIKPPIPYDRFNNLVWDEHRLPRDFDIAIDIVNNPPKYQDFVCKLGNNDSNRVMRLRTIFGYMMHTYRNPAESKAIVFNEEGVNDEPQGGTGKSLCVNAIGKIRKVIDIDGKSFNPKGSFPWERVNETVNLIHIDDAYNGFNFESLFSNITQGFSINQKNKAEYYLPLEKSPKIVITINTVMRGLSESYKRRQYNVDIYPYFNANHTPIDVYGHIFFEQWDSTEWAKFDLYMAQCIQFYLKHGVTACKEANSQQKDAIRATCISFADWFDEAKHDYTSYSGMGGNLAKLAYLESSGQRNIKLSDKRFMTWVQAYCKIYGYGFEKLNHVRPRGFKIALNDDNPPF